MFDNKKINKFWYIYITFLYSKRKYFLRICCNMGKCKVKNLWKVVYIRYNFKYF